MREFSTTLGNALANGLRPNKTVRDGEHLANLLNLVPTGIGVRAYEPFEKAVLLPQEDYPFPLVYDFEDECVVVTQANVYVADKGYVPFDLSETQASNWGLGLFHHKFDSVDYGKNWLLSSPEGVVYRYDGDVQTSQEFQMNSVIHHGNRTLFGGPQNGFWTKSWKKYFSTLIDDNALLESSFYDLDIPKNAIVWSSFDSSDFPFALLHPADFMTTQADLHRMLEANQFGFMEMPFDGEVLALQQLDQQVIVFGTNAIAVLRLALQSPGAAYGLSDLIVSHGIKSRTACASNGSEVIYIDNQNMLRIFGAQGSQVLDFREYMEELTGTIFITQDPHENWWYIGDEKTSFALVEGKLTRINQTVQSIFADHPFRLANVFQTSGTEGTIKSQPLDLGQNALKTLTGVVLGTDSEERLDGYTEVSAWSKGKRYSGKRVPYNYEGYSANRVFGKNHEITFHLNDVTNLQIDFIELKWQIDDRRHTRGVFTTQNASGANQ